MYRHEEGTSGGDKSGKVAIVVNDRALIRNMRDAFSTGSVMGELLQNARRSGATRIEVDYDGDTVVVRDNGRGVASDEGLQAFLSVAQSGWNEETIEREHAFGLGFLSALYSCKHVEVAAKATGMQVGRGFSAATESLLEGGTALIRDIWMNDGARITLRGFNLTDHTYMWPADAQVLVSMMRGQLDRLCRGFPVEVFYNGQQIERPDACDDRHVPTPIGNVRFVLRSHHSYGAYLQGLPIKCGCAGMHGYHYDGTIIHLDDSFRGKLPDRQMLKDELGSHDRIQQTLKDLARDELARQKATLSPESFVMAFANECLHWGCGDLLNDIEFLPGAWFIDWTADHPGHHQNWEDGAVKGGVVSLALLEEEGVYALPETDQMLARGWLAAGQKWTLDEYVPALPDGHWAMRMVQDVSDTDIEVGVSGAQGPNDLPKIAITTMHGDIDVGVVRDLALWHSFKGERYSCSAAYNSETCELLVADGVQWAGDSTRLIGDFVDENDAYCGDEEDRAKADIEDAILRLTVKDRPALLKHLLTRDRGLAAQTQFVNAKLVIEFDEHGKLSSITDAT